MKIISLQTTTHTYKEASELSKHIFSLKLCSCIQISKISSFYTWQDKLENEDEFLLTIKTTKDMYKKLKEEILKVHPYKLAQLTASYIDKTQKEYKSWLIKKGEHMKLIGTRNKEQKVTLKQAILAPSADFGGLFVPEFIPKFKKDFIEKLPDLTYKELSLEIIKAFDFDMDMEIFKKALDRYEDFDDKNCPVNITKIEKNTYINELYHGPTRAFKDMALQPFGEIVDELAQKDKEKYLVMCATSGDTGPATLKTFENSKNVKVVCIYPSQGTSAIQELQMTTLNSNNLKVIAIDGNFDDAQTTLKNLLSDEEFKLALNQNDIKLSAANSVNFGRILFQIIYHFYAYGFLLKNKVLKDDEKFDIVVPSGNFGNALGAYYAKKMGAKIGKIKIATNENDVLDEFFNEGIYDLRKRKLHKTISPAMDILISSNVERLIFDKLGDKKTKKLMQDLKNKKVYKVHKKILKGFKAKSCNDKECAEFINHFAKKGILVDPHTATCFKFKSHKRPTIITSTAHWAKFTPSMIKAIGLQASDSEKQDMLNIAKVFNQDLPKELVELFEKNNSKKTIYDKSEVKNQILEWIKK